MAGNVTLIGIGTGNGRNIALEIGNGRNIVPEIVNCKVKSTAWKWKKYLQKFEFIVHADNG